MRGLYSTANRKRYGNTLMEIALMYGMTYYRVWMMHKAGELFEYIATRVPEGKSTVRR